MRSIFGRLHRWAGLLTAGFLFFSGITGAIISWDHELDDLLNKHLFDVTSSGPAIPSVDLAKLIEQRDPRARVVHMFMTPEKDHSLWFFVLPRIDPATGKRFEPRLQPGLPRSRHRRRARPALMGRGVAGDARELRLVPLHAALHHAHSGVLGHRPLGHARAGRHRHHLDHRLLRRLLSDAAVPPPRQGGPRARRRARTRPRLLGALGAGLEDQDLGQRLSHQFRHPPRLQPVDLGAAVRHRLHGVLAQSVFRGVLAADEDGVGLHPDAL